MNVQTVRGKFRILGLFQKLQRMSTETIQPSGSLQRNSQQTGKLKGVEDSLEFSLLPKYDARVFFRTYVTNEAVDFVETLFHMLIIINFECKLRARCIIIALLETTLKRKNETIETFHTR